MSDDFKIFLSPLKVGPITIRNRSVITAHHTRFVEPQEKDFWSQAWYGKRYAAYVEARAKGGVGLIILGQFAAHPTTMSEIPLHDVPAYDEGVIPGMKMAVDACHKHGTTAFIQLAHSGMLNSGGFTAQPVWSASETAGFNAVVGFGMAKAMDKDDIADLIKHYVLCARNGKAAGVDGVEIHSAHGYLLQQFLSPLYNRRTDEYGGSLENRMRLLMEILAAVRQELGNDKALGVRLSVDEYAPDGLTLADHQEIARRLEAQGAIDYINCSQGTITHSLYMIGPHYTFPHVPFAHHTAAIKEAVNRVKVLAVGRIVDPAEAERLLADGHADFVTMTRAHIADPELVNKAREGRLNEIRACIGDGMGCKGTAWSDVGLRCTQNGCAGHELDWPELAPAAKKKKVMIIGGGIAGMEAAWVAAARGHDVTIYEKSGELGGNALLAREFRPETDGMIRWRKVMLEKYGVKVIFNTEVTPEMIEKENPDAVVVATGATMRRDGYNPFTYKEVAGYDQPNVTIPEDILTGKAQAGENVLIYDVECYARGVGLAEKLVNEGKTVRLVTPTPSMGAFDIPGISLIHGVRLIPMGVQPITQTLVLNIEGSNVQTMHIASKKIETISGIDTVVIVGHGTSNNSTYQALKGKIPELHCIGDALIPRRLDYATQEGHKVGRNL